MKARNKKPANLVKQLCDALLSKGDAPLPFPGLREYVVSSLVLVLQTVPAAPRAQFIDQTPFNFPDYCAPIRREIH